MVQSRPTKIQITFLLALNKQVPARPYTDVKYDTAGTRNHYTNKIWQKCSY